MVDANKKALRACIGGPLDREIVVTDADAIQFEMETSIYDAYKYGIYKTKGGEMPATISVNVTRYLPQSIVWMNCPMSFWRWEDWSPLLATKIYLMRSFQIPGKGILAFNWSEWAAP